MEDGSRDDVGRRKGEIDHGRDGSQRTICDYNAADDDDRNDLDIEDLNLYLYLVSSFYQFCLS